MLKDFLVNVECSNLPVNMVSFQYLLSCLANLFHPNNTEFWIFRVNTTYSSNPWKVNNSSFFNIDFHFSISGFQLGISGEIFVVGSSGILMQIVQEKSEKCPCWLKSKLKGLCILVLNLVQTDLFFSLCFCRSGRSQMKNSSAVTLLTQMTSVQRSAEFQL